MTAKKAHYITAIRTNQPTTHRQLAALPRNAIPVQHTASTAAHGRRESRSIKTCAIADNLRGTNFPHRRLALRLHRRRRSAGQRETRTTVYAVTSLDAHQTSPAGLVKAIRGHWGIENSSHNIRDVTFAEDASRVHTGTAPRALTIRGIPNTHTHQEMAGGFKVSGASARSGG
ncbi:ISAs1 family transposase [Streptomyces flaveolus]|uniref:ISAs1 family transposase n=1 Tax=Streptomyces flaveolus TaxID=67297 RepID=UPI00342A52C0